MTLDIFQVFLILWWVEDGRSERWSRLKQQIDESWFMTRVALVEFQYGRYIADYVGYVSVGPGYGFDDRMQRDRRTEGESIWSWIPFSGQSDITGSQKWWRRWNVCNRTRKDFRGSLAQYWQMRPDGLNTLNLSRSCQEDFENNTYECIVRHNFNENYLTETTTYECCAGFQKTESGCLGDLIYVLDQLNATQLIEGFRHSGLLERLEKDTFTIFVPNKIDEKYNSSDPSNNLIGTATYHVINGSAEVESDEEWTEKAVVTMFPRSKIYLGRFHLQDGLSSVAVNCIPILKSDITASNGLVHIIDGVLSPIQRNLKELMAARQDLSMFKRAMAGIRLKEDRRHTLFAFTDSAFHELAQVYKVNLINGTKCGLDILAKHVLPSIVCSCGVGAVLRTRNLGGGRTIMTQRQVAGQATKDLFVDGITVVERDLMATDGVLHIVNRVIMSADDEDVLEMMGSEKSGLKKFSDLINLAGLTDYIRSLDSFTMFLPTDDALKVFLLDTRNADLESDPKRLERVIKSHVISGSFPYNRLHNDILLHTSADDVNEIRVKEFHSSPFGRHVRKTVQCGMILDRDIKFCRGVAHSVNKVLEVTSLSVLDLLRSRTEFSMLVDLLGFPGMENVVNVLRSPDAVTIFAPTNQAFQALSSDISDRWKEEPNILKRVILSHIIIDSLCCSGIFASRFLPAAREVNLDGWMISIDRLVNGTVSVGSTAIETCDMVASNGVVHGINSWIPEVIRKFHPDPTEVTTKSKFIEFWEKLFT